MALKESRKIGNGCGSWDREGAGLERKGLSSSFSSFSSFDDDNVKSGSQLPRDPDDSPKISMTSGRRQSRPLSLS